MPHSDFEPIRPAILQASRHYGFFKEEQWFPLYEIFVGGSLRCFLSIC